MKSNCNLLYLHCNDLISFKMIFLEKNQVIAMNIVAIYIYIYIYNCYKTQI